MSKAAVLLSGGMDSTTALAQAIADGATQINAVSIKYGSLHETAEMKAADAIAHHYVNHADQGAMIVQMFVDMPRIFGHGRSALMGDVPVPLEDYRDYEGGEGESVTVVPFRNANLISVAVTLAEVYQYPKVYLGMHASDHGTWAYPDCTPEFLGAMANAVYVGTRHRVRLVFPFIWMTKADVVTRGTLLDVPFELTYSCYQGGEVHCGECPTCNERKLAFDQAGVADPTRYLK